jgi:hypothetical protein
VPALDGVFLNMCRLFKPFLMCCAALLITACSKDNDDDIEMARYCQMVEIWTSQAERGIAEEDRHGWPPFNGPCPM